MDRVGGYSDASASVAVAVFKVIEYRGSSGALYGTDVMEGGVWQDDGLLGYHPTDHSLSDMLRRPHETLMLTLKMLSVTSAETLGNLRSYMPPNPESRCSGLKASQRSVLRISENC